MSNPIVKSITPSFSRKAIWLAVDSEHGDRLQEIAIERIRLTCEIVDSRKLSQQDFENKSLLIEKLDGERDRIIQPFQNQLDRKFFEKQKITYA